jgi:hypothetical protein
MSFGSFINAPIRGDRGKKILNDQSHYVQQDYLKDTRPEHEKKVRREEQATERGTEGDSACCHLLTRMRVGASHRVEEADRRCVSRAARGSCYALANTKYSAHSLARVFHVCALLLLLILLQTHLVGKSDGRAAKFKVGFYRRPAAAIQPSLEREAQERDRAEFAQRATEARTAHLRAVNERNGNVLVPVPAPVDAPLPLFARRRRFPEREQAVAALNHARQKIGASRFHTELTPAEAAARDRQIAVRLASQQQTTSVLGYGRGDLPTGGVVDCFRQLAPYSGADLLSKPKLKPPPPDSLAALRSVGQLRIEDGSAQYGRRAGRGGGAHGRDGSVDPASLSGRAGEYPPMNGSGSGRRPNRSNRTSAGMSEAFSYTAVLDADAASRARRSLLPDQRAPVAAAAAAAQQQPPPPPQQQSAQSTS